MRYTLEKVGRTPAKTIYAIVLMSGRYQFTVERVSPINMHVAFYGKHDFINAGVRFTF